jgi:hypothetical protein
VIAAHQDPSSEHPLRASRVVAKNYLLEVDVKAIRAFCPDELKAEFFSAVVPLSPMASLLPAT